MKIGHRIRESRERLQLSQDALAQRIGVSQPTISDWENSKTEPTVDNMRTLAVELGIWFEWLVTGRGTRDYHLSLQQPQEEYRVCQKISADEQKLQTIYRDLSPERRKALLEFLKRWG